MSMTTWFYTAVLISSTHFMEQCVDIYNVSLDCTLKSRYFRNSASGTEAKTSDTSVLPWLEDDLSALQHCPLVPLVVPRDEKQKWSNQHHLIHTITLSNYTLYGTSG